MSDVSGDGFLPQDDDISLSDISSDESINDVATLKELLTERENDARMAAQIGKALVEKNAELGKQLTAVATQLDDERRNTTQLTRTIQERTLALRESEEARTTMLDEISKLEQLLHEAQRAAAPTSQLRADVRRLTDSVERQKDTLQRAQERNEELNRLNGKLSGDKKALERELAEQRERLEALRTESAQRIEEAERRRKKLASTLDRLRVENSSLENALGNADVSEVVALLGSEVERLRREREETQRLLEAERRRAILLTEQVDELTMAVHSREQENREASHAENATTVAAVQRAVLDSMRRTEATVSEAMRALSKRIEAAHASAAEQRRVLVAHEQAVSSAMDGVEARRSAAVRAAATHQEALKRVQQRSDELQGQLISTEERERAAEAETKRVNGELERREQEMAHLRRLLDTSRTKLSVAQRQLIDARSQVKESREANEKQALLISDLRASLSEAQALAARRAAELAERQRAAVDASDQDTAALQAAEQSAAEAARRCAELDAQLAAARSEAKRVAIAADRDARLVASLRSELAQQKQAAERTRAALDRQERAVEQLNRRIDELSAQLRDERAKNAHLQRCIDELRDQLRNARQGHEAAAAEAEVARETAAKAKAEAQRQKEIATMEANDDGGMATAHCGCEPVRCARCRRTVPQCCADDHKLVCTADEARQTCPLASLGCEVTFGLHTGGWSRHLLTCVHDTVVCKVNAESGAGFCGQFMHRCEYAAHCATEHARVVHDVVPSLVMGGHMATECPAGCGELVRGGTAFERHLRLCPDYVAVCTRCHKEMQREAAISHHCAPTSAPPPLSAAVVRSARAALRDWKALRMRRLLGGTGDAEATADTSDSGALVAPSPKRHGKSAETRAAAKRAHAEEVVRQLRAELAAAERRVRTLGGRVEEVRDERRGRERDENVRSNNAEAGVAASAEASEASTTTTTTATAATNPIRAMSADNMVSAKTGSTESSLANSDRQRMTSVDSVAGPTRMLKPPKSAKRVMIRRLSPTEPGESATAPERDASTALVPPLPPEEANLEATLTSVPAPSLPPEEEQDDEERPQLPAEERVEKVRRKPSLPAPELPSPSLLPRSGSALIRKKPPPLPDDDDSEDDSKTTKRGTSRRRTPKTPRRGLGRAKSKRAQSLNSSAKSPLHGSRDGSGGGGGVGTKQSSMAAAVSAASSPTKSSSTQFAAGLMPKTRPKRTGSGMSSVGAATAMSMSTSVSNADLAALDRISKKYRKRK